MGENITSLLRVVNRSRGRPVEGGVWGEEITWRWVELMPTFGVAAALGAVVAAGLVSLRARMSPPVAASVLAVFAALGAAEVWRRLSLVDDGWISFRYARNLLRGDGLV